MQHTRMRSARRPGGQLRLRRERGLNGREHGWSLCGNCR
jgi:hypothetical protein